MNGPARPGLDVANSAKRAANTQRAKALLAVTNGDHTVVGTITEACSPAGRPLLRLTLRQLLLAQPGWGDDRVSRVIDQTATILGLTEIPGARRLTVAWLMDHRAAGRRFMAFCDALNTRADELGRGFPFAASTYTTAHSGRGHQ